MAFFDYSKIDVEEYLNDLGMNNIKKMGKDWWFSCPLDGHMGADTTPSASMEEGTTRVHCFGCGFSGNAVSFLAKLEGVSQLKARKWLREKFGMAKFLKETESFSLIIRKRAERMREADTKPKPKRTHKHFSIINEKELEKRYINWSEVWDAWRDKMDYAYPLAYMLDRGFRPDTLEKWAVGWDMISQRICIPIRDDLGNLIGFKGRSVDRLPKYLVLGGDEYGFETYNVSKVLFGLDKAKNHPSKHLIVREGELNVIALDQVGYTNVVGLSGKELSKTHENLIKKYFESVAFSFDEEKDALKAAQKLKYYMPTYILPATPKDPSDMLEEEIHEYMSAWRSVAML